MKQLLAIALLCCIGCTGCSTIINTTTQEVLIRSNPSNAKITIDGKKFGTTPQVVNLERGSHHMVKFELIGYEPYEVQITNKISQWVWLNALNGFLLGLTVDYLNGAMYDLYPEQFEAKLSAVTKQETPAGKK